MNKILSYFVFGWLAKGHEKANKGNSAEPFVYGRYGVPHARVGENVLECGYWRGAYMRERERVANYLELPNNSTTFLQGKSFFPALCIHLYDIRNVVVNYDVKSAILSEFRMVWLQS